MTLSRKIAEHLMRRASEGKITSLERAALRWHLEEDAVSRERAWELARFLHDEKPAPKQDKRKAEALHNRVMEEAAAELEKQNWRQREGLPTANRSRGLGLAPALALSAVTVALITFLTLPAPETVPTQHGHDAAVLAPKLVAPETEKAAPLSGTAKSEAKETSAGAKPSIVSTPAASQP